MRAILFGGGIALLISLLGTRVAIDVLSKRGYGQEIREDGPTTHHTKRGHPDDGRHGHHPGHRDRLLRRQPADRRRRRAPRRCCCSSSSSGLGFVGFLDDFIKIVKQRSLGLRSAAKMIGQTVMALVFGVLALSPMLEDENHRTPASHHISFIKDIGWELPGRRRPADHLAPGRRLQQRGQPHRRAGRAGHRRVHDGLRRLHAGEHLAEQPVLRRAAQRQLLRGARPARPGHRLGGDHRRLLRVPVVERVPGGDLHGRHRLPRPGRCARRAGDPDPHRGAAAHPRRALRHRDAVGDPAGRRSSSSARASASSGSRPSTTTSRWSAGRR